MEKLWKAPSLLYAAALAILPLDSYLLLSCDLTTASPQPETFTTPLQQLYHSPASEELLPPSLPQAKDARLIYRQDGK